MMRLSALLAVATILVASDNPRSRCNQIKVDARAAAAAGDWQTAEAKYRVLLSMESDFSMTPYEIHAEVVTPLAKIYRANEDTEKLEDLYVGRVEQSRPGLERGLAEADLGFYYQGADTSADRFHGERLVERAMSSFSTCATRADAQCRKRLLDTAGLQGAVFFQQRKYAPAETLFRQVVSAPESDVTPEVLLVSMHALRGILVLRKDFDEARALELRAASIEARNPAALARLRSGTQERSRSR